MAVSAYAMTSKKALIRYLHQYLFTPTKKTLVKAIENNKLTTWNGLTAEAFASTSMNRHQQQIKATRNANAKESDLQQRSH